ncbi:MAG: hypothetical protein M3Q33_04175 [Acidobacteriota bacterium]|nr:hypothetical protein [Acidobacteriota bacterium]
MMINRNLISILFILLIIALNVGNAYGQDENPSDLLDRVDSLLRENLGGLKKVRIFVNPLDKAIKESGLTEAQLRTEAEIRLRRVGIYDEKASAFINIYVTNTEVNDYFIKYKLKITLTESARLERNNSSLSVTTWERTDFATVEKNQIQNTIRNKVEQKMDQFIKDYQTDNSKPVKNKPSPILQKPETRTTTTSQNQDDSPFTAVYVGGNRPPEVEIFNDTNRTLYLDFGQDKLTPYTISSKTSKKFTLTEGIYKFKATASRVIPLEGQDSFQKGYTYTWRFTIVTQRIK